MSNVGKNLKMIRKIFRYTQKDIAEMIHVTPQAVSRWEVGDIVPNVELLQQFGNFYHLSVDDILDPNLSCSYVHEKYLEVKKIEEENKRLSDEEIEPNVFLRFIKTRNVGFYMLWALSILLITMACVYSVYFNRIEFFKYHHFTVELFLALGVVAGVGLSISKFTNKFAGFAMFGFNLLSFAMFIKYGYMYFTELFFAGIDMEVISQMDPGYKSMLILYLISFVLLIAVQFIPQTRRLKAKKDKTKESK